MRPPNAVPKSRRHAIMSRVPWHNELRIPGQLTAQLRAFRRRVWIIKLVEAMAMAASCVLIAFLCVFALDRLFDTSPWLRVGIGVGALIGCGVVPWFFH